MELSDAGRQPARHARRAKSLKPPRTPPECGKLAIIWFRPLVFALRTSRHQFHQTLFTVKVFLRRKKAARVFFAREYKWKGGFEKLTLSFGRQRRRERSIEFKKCQLVAIIAGCWCAVSIWTRPPETLCALSPRSKLLAENATRNFHSTIQRFTWKPALLTLEKCHRGTEKSSSKGVFGYRK